MVAPRPASSDVVALSSGLAAVSQSVLRLLASRLDMEICLLTMRDGDRYVVLQACDVVFGLQPGPLGAWSDSLCAAMTEGHGPPVATDVLDVPAYKAVVEKLGLPIRAYAAVALHDRDGEVLGTLCALSTKTQSQNLHDQYALLSTFGMVLGEMLDRELQIRTADSATTAALAQARTDPLTGVLNLRGWDEALRDTERRCRMTDEDAAVFIVDLDDVKSVNDVQGHDAGDGLLRRAAAALHDAVMTSLAHVHPGGSAHASTPGVSAVARTGGDEFAVLLTGFDAISCAEVASQLQSALSDAGVAGSLGYAMRHPARGLVLTCRDADQLMLADKRRHRLQVPRPRETPDALATSPVAVVNQRSLDSTTPAVERLLRRVRGLFGLEAAFVSRLADGQQIFTYIDADDGFPVSVGDRRSLEITLCQRVLDGLLPSVITDATQHEHSAGIDVVQAGLVRTYLTVPVRLPDGHLYGTLCCTSSQPRPDLTEHAAAALAFAAEQVGELLGRDRENTATHREAQNRLDLLLRTGGLRIALQPVVDLRTGQSVGAEALARFDDGRSPDLWFPEAASIGQCERLELAAFDAAVGSQIPDGTFLAVNLSPAVLMSDVLQDRLREMLAAGSSTLSRIVIELTEHEPVDDYGALAAALAPFRARGLRLAVDDTGAGHSSLTHVLQLRPDVMKLDRALITAIDRDPVRRALVKSLRHFCMASEVQLIAEGVETPQEAAALVSIGVRLAQGFHLGRPVLAVPDRGPQQAGTGSSVRKPPDCRLQSSA